MFFCLEVACEFYLALVDQRSCDNVLRGRYFLLLRPCIEGIDYNRVGEISVRLNYEKEFLHESDAAKDNLLWRKLRVRLAVSHLTASSGEQVSLVRHQVSEFQFAARCFEARL